LGEHKAVTPKQQLLGIILCFLCIQNGCGYSFPCENAVEAIQISSISMILSLKSF
jgi:hypothetical protein